MTGQIPGESPSECPTETWRSSLLLPPSALLISPFDSQSFTCFLFGPAADINLDLSKPFKANLSFTKLDQISNFLQKVTSAHGKEPTSPAEATLSRDEPSAPRGHQRKLLKFDDQPETPFQESLWRAMSCFQRISVHTRQIVVSMEPVPHPQKPCLLASLSALTGSLHMRASARAPGESQREVGELISTALGTQGKGHPASYRPGPLACYLLLGLLSGGSLSPTL